MPDLLTLLVGSIAGVAGLLLSPLWRRGRDALLVALVVGLVVAWGVDLVPLPFANGASAALVLVTLAAMVVAAAAAWEGVATFGRLPVCVALFITAGGVYGCVPDTEQISVILTLLAVLGVARVAGLNQVAGDPAVVSALAASIMWAAGIGAVGRPAAMVGAVGCLGVVLSLPAWRRLAERPSGLSGGQMWAAVGTHTALVFVLSRLVGLKTSVGTALALGIPVLLVGAAAAAALDGLLSNRGRRQAQWGSARTRPSRPGR